MGSEVLIAKVAKGRILVLKLNEQEVTREHIESALIALEKLEQLPASQVLKVVIEPHYPDAHPVLKEKLGERYEIIAIREKRKEIHSEGKRTGVKNSWRVIHSRNSEHPVGSRIK